MALARFRKLCLDSVDPTLVGPFWAAALDRRWEPDGTGEGGVAGPTKQHMLWVNLVPEARTVKHRVHLDIYAHRLADLEALGSAVVLPEGDDRGWTVMTDPEGGEYCAFLREQVPAERLHGLGVDCVDAAAQADWWARVYGARLVHDPRGFSSLEDVPDMPILTMDFAPVPEPKVGKNRIHWDVTVPDVQPLLDVGATVLREPGGDVSWYVLADPEGNEFCAVVEDGPG